MRLSPEVMGVVVVITLLFALYLVFSVYSLIMQFYPYGFSYGKDYFDVLLLRYVGSIVFSAIVLTAGITVLYKSKER
jgi:hypothetical protein